MDLKFLCSLLRLELLHSPAQLAYYTAWNAATPSIQSRYVGSAYFERSWNIDHTFERGHIHNSASSPFDQKYITSISVQGGVFRVELVEFTATVGINTRSKTIDRFSSLSLSNDSAVLSNQIHSWFLTSPGCNGNNFFRLPTPHPQKWLGSLLLATFDNCFWQRICQISYDCKTKRRFWCISLKLKSLQNSSRVWPSPFGLWHTLAFRFI